MKAGAFRPPPRREVQPGSRVLPTSQGPSSSSTTASNSRGELLSSWGTSSNRLAGRARSSTLGGGADRSMGSSRMPVESTAMSRARTLGLKRAPRDVSPPPPSRDRSRSESRSPSPPRHRPAQRGRSQSFAAPAAPSRHDSRRYESDEESSEDDYRRLPTSRTASRARSYSRARSPSPSPPRPSRTQSRPPSRTASRARSYSHSRLAASPPPAAPPAGDAPPPTTSYLGSLWGKASQVLAAATGAGTNGEQETEKERPLAPGRQGSLQRTKELGVPESSITPFEVREEQLEGPDERSKEAEETKPALNTLRHARTRPRPPPTASQASASLVSATLLQKPASARPGQAAPSRTHSAPVPAVEPITWHRPPALHPRDHHFSISPRRSTNSSPFDWLEPSPRFALDEFLFHRHPKRAATRMVRTRMMGGAALLAAAGQRQQMPMRGPGFGNGQQMWRQAPSVGYPHSSDPRWRPPPPPQHQQQYIPPRQPAPLSAQVYPPHPQQSPAFMQQRAIPEPRVEPLQPPPLTSQPPVAPSPPSFVPPASFTPATGVATAVSLPVMPIAQPPWPVLSSSGAIVPSHPPPPPSVAAAAPLVTSPSPPQPPVPPLVPAPAVVPPSFPCPPSFPSPPPFPFPSPSPLAPAAVRSPSIPPTSPMPLHMRQAMTVIPLSMSPEPLSTSLTVAASTPPAPTLDLPPSPPPPPSSSQASVGPVAVVDEAKHDVENGAVAAPTGVESVLSPASTPLPLSPDSEVVAQPEEETFEQAAAELADSNNEDRAEVALPLLELEWSLPDLGIGFGFSEEEPKSALVAPEAFFSSIGLGSAVLEMEKSTSASAGEQLPLPVPQPFVEEAEDEDDLEAAFAATAAFVSEFREEQVPLPVDRNHDTRMQRWFEEQGVRAPAGMHEVVVASDSASSSTFRPRTAPPASLSPPLAVISSSSTLPALPIPSPVVRPLVVIPSIPEAPPSPTGAEVELVPSTSRALASTTSKASEISSPLVGIDPIFAGW